MAQRARKKKMDYRKQRRIVIELIGGKEKGLRAVKGDKKFHHKSYRSRRWWLTPVILATQEAEIRV
jgi:hypothetical protein